jgi:hypothetical protein
MIAEANIKRGGVAPDKTTQKKICDSLPDIFVGHQKLIYVPDRQDGLFAYTAALHGEFTLGEGVLNDICTKVEVDVQELNKSNVFYKHFK